VASAYGWVARVLLMVKRAHIFHILTIFSVITDRAILKESPEFADVIIEIFSIDASESREPFSIPRGHLSRVSWYFAHI
jgi:hypothetical protein